MINQDKHYMRMALELALKGWGRTNPNPLVGSVIVKDSRVIGQGYHALIGGAHAEAAALANLTESPEGASIYVNLEPCSHYGKTPPCADAIIKAGIKRVVIGMEDPNPIVSGKGIARLRDNSIEVVCGVMEEEARKLNEIFIKYITKKLPFVIIKSAMTLDGKIATYTGDSKWITSEESRRYVHKIRERVSGVMVGINTVIKDNPLLTVRHKVSDAKNPIRIVVDSNGQIPLDAAVIESSKDSYLILATVKDLPEEKAEILKSKNVRILVCPGNDGRVDLSALMRELGKLQIDSVLIEGGGELNFSALNSGAADKVMMFIAPKIIGGREALTPFEGLGKGKVSDAYSLKNIEITKFADDILIEGYFKE